MIIRKCVNIASLWCYERIAVHITHMHPDQPDTSILAQKMAGLSVCPFAFLGYYLQFYWMTLVVHKIHTSALKNSGTCLLSYLTFNGSTRGKVEKMTLSQIQQSMNSNYNPKMLIIKNVHEEISKERSTQYTTIGYIRIVNQQLRIFCIRFSRCFQVNLLSERREFNDFD